MDSVTVGSSVVMVVPLWHDVDHAEAVFVLVWAHICKFCIFLLNFAVNIKLP